MTSAGWEPVSTGCSGAVVRRSPDGATYTKSAVEPWVRAELVAERDRLLWLASAGLPAAEVVDWDEDAATLTTRTVPGVPLSDLPARVAVPAARSLASFLRRLHAVDVASCPFDRRLAVMLPLARRRVADGLVDEADFDAERAGRTAASVLTELEPLASRALALEPADLAVCHGDACLPNVLVDPATLAVTGMVDVGRLGVADRHLDLALAHRSMSASDLNPGFGPAVADQLLASYGLPVDPWRLALHRLLDELI